MGQGHWSRRGFMGIAAGAPAAALLAATPSSDASGRPAPQATDDLIRGVEVATLRRGRDGGTTWFHPRACTVPAEKGAVAVMTLQDITGSDVFGPVHWSQSANLGATWTEPQPIPGLGRRDRAGGVQEGVCDVVPEYHVPTRAVLAIGHTVFYKGGKFFADQPARQPVYVVRDPSGQWSEPRRLAWDDPRGTAIYTCGCVQRVTLAGGDVLVPLSFGPKGRTDRGVATALCTSVPGPAPHPAARAPRVGPSRPASAGPVSRRRWR